MNGPKKLSQGPTDQVGPSKQLPQPSDYVEFPSRLGVQSPAVVGRVFRGKSQGEMPSSASFARMPPVIRVGINTNMSAAKRGSMKSQGDGQSPLLTPSQKL